MTPTPIPPSAKPILSFARAMVECYQSFAKLSSQHIRECGLTPSQFDVLATLGNTSGMTCKALGEKTLITKGTLTGILDRMTEKGWITRQEMADKRCIHITLTETGHAMFAKIFPLHLQHLQEVFGNVPEKKLIETTDQLKAIKAALK